MSTVDDWRQDVAAKLAHTRARTIALVEPLAETQLEHAVREFMSPLLWDLGHLAGFEHLWLVDALADAAADGLESKYDALETPRHERAALELPQKAAVLDEMRAVRCRVLEVLEDVDLGADNPILDDGYVYRMVIQHEGQHQETMLQSLDLPATANWGHPSLAGGADASAADGDTEEAADIDGVGDSAELRRGANETRIDDVARVAIDAGAFSMGTTDRSRAYDNERPVHRVDVDGFEIDRYPATNRRWVAFIDDDGYGRRELWSEGGQQWLDGVNDRCPQGWSRVGGGWHVHRFGGLGPLVPEEPVQHVSYWEAEAFARWCGGRLPTEAEWEKAAAWGPGAECARTYPWGEDGPRRAGLIRADGGAKGVPVNLAGGNPPPVGRHPRLASRYAVEDMLGLVYEWTASPFGGYPGFEPFPYAEYSQVFFGDRYRVLRGASWAAHPMLWRNTYRNWDLPQRRQIFAGVRVAYGDG